MHHMLVHILRWIIKKAIKGDSIEGILALAVYFTDSISMFCNEITNLSALFAALVSNIMCVILSYYRLAVSCCLFKLNNT